MLIYNNNIFLTEQERHEYLNTILELNLLLDELQIQVIYV